MNGRRGPKFTFWYNPSEIEESFTTGLADIKIPGLPVPLKQYSGGGSHTIQFKIVLVDLGDHPVIGTPDKVITDFHDIMMPGYARRGELWNTRGVTETPFVLIFNFGSMEVPCVLKTMTVRRKYFDKDLDTMVAEIDIKLDRVISANMR
jgi:hypothetical protein